MLQNTLDNYSDKIISEQIRARYFYIHNSGMRMVGTECIRNILFILPLGAEWWNGVLSIPEYECGIKERAHFTFMAILIPEL